MQIIPSTARLTARQNGIRLGRIKNLYKPELNIMIGTTYLSGLLAKIRWQFCYAGRRSLMRGLTEQGDGRRSDAEILECGSTLFQ